MKPRFHIFLWSLEGESSQEYYSDKLPSAELTAKYPIQSISILNSVSLKDVVNDLAKKEVPSGPSVSSGGASNHSILATDAGKDDAGGERS